MDWCCGPLLELGVTARFESKSTFAHCYSGVHGGDFDDEGCVTYRINRHGYRGADFAREKPVDAFRIVILGDSFTFGEGTPEPLIYPTRLGEALGARRADGRWVEVVNLGVPGDDARGALATYRSLGRRLAADWVVFQWNTNDFPSPDVQEDHLRLIGARYRKLFAEAEALRWSRLLSVTWLRLQTWRLSREVIATTREDAERGHYAFEAIGRLRSLVEQDGARFTVLAFPELIRFEAYPYAALLEALHAYCRQERIHVIDLLPALAAHRDRELWVHETDHHPNRLAHAIAARELARGIAPASAEPLEGGR
jgi:lysophospholipase L1-like esterase